MGLGVRVVEVDDNGQPSNDIVYPYHGSTNTPYFRPPRHARRIKAMGQWQQKLQNNDVSLVEMEDLTLSIQAGGFGE